MGHKFNVENRHKLDNEQRREILPPYETLCKIGLKQGDIMADIGCGIGYFTMPASEIVGERGIVYAMDISDEMLKEVKEKSSNSCTSNIKIIKTEESNLRIEDASVTFAFICNVLHEMEDIAPFLKEVKRIIADGGKISIIEWEKAQSDFGPPVGHRLDRAYVKHVLQTIGFCDVHDEDIGAYFYAVIGEK